MGSEFEQLRATWVAAMEQRAERSLVSLRASGDALHAQQTDDLRSLLAVARARSPWHADRLRDIEIDEVSASDLSALPTMTKADLMTSWDRAVTDPKLTLSVATAHLHQLEQTDAFEFCLGRYVVAATGGSTGNRGVFALDMRAFAGWVAPNRAHIQAASSLPGEAPRPPGPVRQARITAKAPTHISTAVGVLLGGSVLDVIELPAVLPLREIVAGLNDSQPESIMAYPSVLHRLAVEAIAGRLHIEPVSIGASGEALLPDTAAIVKEAFGVSVRNVYGATEANLAQSVRQDDRLLHVYDTVIVEVVDADNHPVSSGERGAKLLITNLENHVQPLIRYELSDEVAEHVGAAPVPWTGQWIETPLGRMDDWFVYGAAAVHPHLFRSRLSNEPAVTEYQVVQTENGAAINVVVEGALDMKALSARIEADLSTHLDKPEVSVDIVDAIERHAASGKLKRFVPRR